MAVTIGSNISSLRTIRQLDGTTRNLASTSERLASGQRINRASDDAAGLAVAASLNNDARVFNQGVRNINDALSYMNVAEGATGELKNVLIRMRELSTQSSNGTLSNTQRLSLDAETQALVQEYNRVVATTKFNGVSIFAAGAETLVVQAGYGTGGTLRADMNATTITSGDGTFQATVSYGGGDQAISITLADLNGDGVLDLITTAFNEDKANVLLGNGDGTFKAKVSYAGGDGPQSVAIADLNGDGVLDLITASDTDDKANVLFGNGDGTFKATVSYAGGDGSRSVAIADLNNDGALDLISASNNDDNANVLLGNGDGTFKANVSYAGGDGSRSVVAVADLNGDGVLDLITASQNDDKANVLFGNGDGTFKAKVAYDGGNAPQSVAVADLNGDGALDLMTAAQLDDKAYVLFGNGDGTFKAKAAYDGGDGAYAVVASDLNGDGALDLITASETDDKANVLFGNGDGTFKAKVSYDGGNSPRMVAVADLNGDGALDLITASFTDDKANVLLGNPVQRPLGISSIGGISTATRSDALGAQSTIDGHLQVVNTVAGVIGASQSRLNSAARTLMGTRDNSIEAASRIQDADVAQESANLVRHEILQQTASGVLAQANQQPRIAIQLLGAI